MKNWVILFLAVWFCSGCASFWDLFKREQALSVRAPESTPAAEPHKRVTRRSLEEESMLNESSGSLWVGRGQASFLFANNNYRMIGDLLNVSLEGYPKEQIQTKANVISKLLSEILNEQRQEIKLKQEEIQKKITPPTEAPQQSHFLQRNLASNEADPNQPQVDPQVELKQTEKDLKKINEEEEEIKGLQKGKEFPIRAVPTRVVEIQSDGNYRVRGEQPFMIGKREYKVLIVGTVRAEEYNEKGVSAEILLDPIFDIISDKKDVGPL